MDSNQSVNQERLDQAKRDAQVMKEQIQQIKNEKNDVSRN